jgi:hypothetical protein
MYLCCKECGSRLAYDQRYCLDCGARRGALRPTMAQWIGIETAAGPVAAPEADARAGTAGSEQARRQSSMPSPRVLGVAVMALLAFGVLIGSAVSPGQESSANGPLVVAVARTTAAPSAVATAEAPTLPPPAASEETPVPSTSESATPTSTTPAAKPKSAEPGKTKTSEPESGSAATLPPIKHVFLIVLSDQGFNQTFGPSAPTTYLSKTLVGKGELLDDFYAVTGGELANEIALISGQGPTAQTAEDCPLYANITPGTVGASGQVLGSGCVYPSQTDTLAEQLTADGLTWKAYVEGIGEGAAQPATCPHPALDGVDGDHAPTAEDPSVTWRDPFVYFESVTGNATCASSVVGLGQLAPSLTVAKNTPALSYIVPDRCHDGSEEPCAPGQPSGLAATDSFLSTVVPEIESSPAYKTGGLIAITFDQAPQSGPDADSSGCCMTSAFPNLPATAPSTSATDGEAGASSTTTPAGATGTTTTGTTGTTEAPGSTTTGASSTTPTGGGRVGLLLISKYTKPGSISITGEYNDFSLLASIENLFGLTHLGYAGGTGLLVFNKSVYNAHA